MSELEEDQHSPLPAESSANTAEWSLEGEYFRAIVASSEDAIISKDLNGIVASWNEGACRLFGYSAEEMIGRSIECLLPPARRHEEQFILELIASGERIKHFETVRVGLDGVPIDVSVSISPIRLRDGSVYGASSIVRAIGERIRLSDLEARLAAIVQSSEDAIIGKDLNGVITSWNAGAEAMYGYSADEMLGRPVALLLPPDRAQEQSFILEKIVAGERVEHFETVRQHKDGSLVHVSASISPIYNRAGVVVGAAKIARDISARRALVANLQLTSAVFEHSGEGIAICDPLGRIRKANAAFLRISGFSLAEVEGQRFDMFSVSRLTPQSIATQLTALQTNGHAQGEFWSRRRNGDPFAAVLTVSRIGGQSDPEQGYAVLVTDVTHCGWNRSGCATWSISTP